MTKDPYRLLGLKRNPFVIESKPGVSSEHWIDQIPELPFPQKKQRQLIQILGHKGAGKTSLILHWQKYVGGPYHYVPPDVGKYHFPKIKELCFIDEADRLPLFYKPIIFALAKAKQATLVVGTHEDLSIWAKIFQMSVQTIQFPPLNTKIITLWANHRINSTRLEEEPCLLTLSEQTVQIICDKANNCWRKVGDELHLWAACEARKNYEKVFKKSSR